jgi:predicted RNA-binding Zn ribbon-like protein
MVGERSRRVRLCANEKCAWLFLDDSESGTRRWCSTSSCGNRAKAHRRFLRHVTPAAGADG